MIKIDIEEFEKVLDKISDEIDKEHEEKIYEGKEENKSIACFITKLTETLAREEFKGRIINYFKEGNK